MRILSLFPIRLGGYILSLLLLSAQSRPATSTPYLIRPILSTTAAAASAVVSVRDFGATGDGCRYDTAAIQSAIDACPSPSPCRVVFPRGGKYLTATIRIRSGVVLVVERGAVLLGGTRQEDYPVASSRWYVVLAEQADNVGVTGGGEINGQGFEFIEKFDKRKNVMVSWNKTGDCLGDECRPRLLGFLGCRNVSVWDIKLNQPAYWCLHLVNCDHTSIHDISIIGDFDSPNNDGIDIEDSNNTLITRCHIVTGDDAICPKTSNGPLYNLTATDCWIRSKSSAIKLGSASTFDFVGLVFNNITIFESHRGLGLQIRDGGNVNDVTFSNINISTRYYDPSWWGRAEPIYVTTCPRHHNSKEGNISNLRFINITAVSENGVFLSGSKNGHLQNLKFTNIDITYRRWTNYEGGLADYRPGCRGMVKHTMSGIIMENLDGFEVDNVNIRWDKAGGSGDWDDPLQFRPSTVSNISLVNFHSGWYDSK